MSPQVMRSFRLGAGAALGVFLAWLVFRGTDWEKVAVLLGDLEVPWLLVALTFASSGHLARVQRWSYIVRATQTVRFRTLFSAAQIGFLFNIALPLRLGEVVRALVLSRLAHLRLVTSVALIALDRVADTLAFLTVVVIAIAALPTDQGAILAGRAITSMPSPPLWVGLLTGMLGIGIVLFAISKGWGRHARWEDASGPGLHSLLLRSTRRITRSISSFLTPFRAFWLSEGVAPALVFSLLAWMCGVLSLASGMRALHVTFPWNAPFLMQAMIGLFVIVPLTPGLVGQFHLPIVAALAITAPDVATTEAKAVALVAHVIMLIPVVTFGVLGLATERLTLREAARTGAEVQRA